MATIARTQSMTADEFFDDPDVPELAELVDGEVVELTTPPPLHGWIARNVQRALDAFVTAHRLGEVFGDNVPYMLGHEKVRVPDVSFVRTERVPGPPPPRGGWPMAPDLAVEVLSPSERYAAVRKKLADYFGAGTRQVWLVDPDDRIVEVHTMGGTARQVDEAGTVDGGDLLPDFTLAVADVFAGVPPGRAPEPEGRKRRSGRRA